MAQGPLNIFISYAHADQHWHKRLMTHLAPLEMEYDVEAWSDQRLRAGSHWQKKIEAAINKAEVTLLLVSADFLASKFIREQELPPLLAKAESDGTLVVPIIIGPSLFNKTPTLNVFQAINDPARPIVCLSKGEQEDVFLQVAEFINDTINARLRQPDDESTIKESFIGGSAWSNLTKIGSWDLIEGAIVGTGIGSIILSEKEYGESPFEIETTLKFDEFQRPSGDPTIGMNAGIVFGWLSGYFNVLLTGDAVLIERSGKSPDPAERFGHLTALTPLRIEAGVDVHLRLLIGNTNIELFVNGARTLTMPRPSRIKGRVGLRAWRSKMTCSKFNVCERVE